MKLREVHTVPVWDDNGTVRVCGTDEVRDDLADHVIGWANLLVIDLNDERHVLLAVDTP